MHADDLWSLLPESCDGLDQFTTRELAERLGRPLWFAQRDDGFEAASEPVLASLDIPFEHLSALETAARWPQASVEGVAWSLFEPEAGVIRARRGERQRRNGK